MKRYIRESDLRAITAGSLEEKRRNTIDAIDAFEKSCSDPKVEDEALKRPLSLVATFEHHAVVADASGGFHLYTLAEGKALSRSVYDGFKTLSEVEARKDSASILDEAAGAVIEGKDPTASIAKLMRL